MSGEGLALTNMGQQASTPIPDRIPWSRSGARPTGMRRPSRFRGGRWRSMKRALGLIIPTWPYRPLKKPTYLFGEPLA